MRIVFLLTIILASARVPAHAQSAASFPPERMVIERVVPSGATLTYAVDGVVVSTIQVPEGRVRVIMEFGSAPSIRRGTQR